MAINDVRLPDANILKNPVLTATKFGVPTCILDYDDEIMSLLPSAVGSALGSQVDAGINAANSMTGDILNGVLGIFDITIWDSVNGTFMWDAKDYGGGGLEAIGNMASALAFGVQAWNNYVVVDKAFTKLSDCWNEVFNSEDEDGGGGSIPSTIGPGANAAVVLAQVNGAQKFLSKAHAWQAMWADIMAARFADPALEPQFNVEIPGFIYAVDDAVEVDRAPIFDLVYGPPVLKEGQMIITSDGLYYNSQTATYEGGDIPDKSDIGVVYPPDAWKMNHFPSLGGKGQSYSMQDLEEYVDTLFDAAKIDNGEDLQEHYKEDHLLNVLQGQKTKEVYDVSTQINTLIASGYEKDSAMVVNMKQSLYATVNSYNIKIDKRKKQIEVAAKAPDLYGSSSFEPGEVPINDFTFLKNINLAVDVRRQKALTFEHGEVSSVVLPLRPKFVRSVDSESVPLLHNLVVPPIGTGSMYYQSPDDRQTSSLSKIVSLNDEIVTDGLFAIYSFLEGGVVDPNSKKYQVLNCATTDNYNNCQLVAASSQDVFASGLGIPFLRGITKVGFDQSTETNNVSGVGSYLRMPSTKEFQNLLYNPKGASFDFWVHLPKFGDITRPYGGPTATGEGGAPVTNKGDGSWSTYQYNKLILACENTGGPDLNKTATEIHSDRGSEVVRGFVMGFSREKILVEQPPQIPTTDTDEAGASAKMVFYMAPTQSVNNKDVEFINKRPQDTGESGCYNANDGIYKMIVPVEEEKNNVSFLNAKEEFVHVNVSFDVPHNQIAVYLDGDVFTTSAITDVFPVERLEPPQLPSFYKPLNTSVSSFTYNQDTLTQVGISKFNKGPSLDGFFTPWIVGGGWTDGIPANYGGDDSGGFMSARHGYGSGLDGFVGSLKFYSRPLNTQEVNNNYLVQRVFFKNIIT